MGGEIICIDPWMDSVDTAINKKSIYKIMAKALRKNKIFNLFQHNIYAAGFNKVIFPFRGFSDNRLTMFRNDLFDIIYIDGSHSYKDVIKDLRNAGPLVKERGILCGDDLELQCPNIDIGNAEKNKYHDFIMDPQTQEYFHPGVSLAVYEFFGQEISVYHGFWVMRKIENKWGKVNLKHNEPDIEIPHHLR